MLLENHPYPEDTRVRNEAEALVAAGHEVTVIAPRGPGQAPRAVVGGVRVRRYRVPQSPGTRRGYLREYAVAHLQLLPRAIAELVGGATVLHLHNPPDTLFPAAGLARAMGRRVVFDLHDLAPELLEAKFGRSSLTPLLRALQRASIRSADAVLVTNDSQHEVAAAGASRVEVVRNGPPAATLVAEPRTRPGRLADPHLVFVGNLDKQDGALVLVDVLAALHRDHGLLGAHLTVAGEGAGLGAVRARISAERLTPFVRLLGRVDHARVPALLAEADVCLEPAPCSRLNDRSTMIKVGEYLAAARPVVAFDLLETRRSAGDAALYARCNDAEAFAAQVARLAADPALRARLAARGLARASELTWGRSAGVLLRVYGEL